MPDPRTNLPQGTWTVTHTKVLPRRTPDEPPTLWFFAKEAATADEARAYLTVGDLSGYSTKDWALPAKLPNHKLWYLSRIEPRMEKARGGTAALLRGVSRLADARGVWVIAEVKTGDDRRNALVRRVLGSHGGFVSSHHTFADMMTRRPRP